MHYIQKHIVDDLRKSDQGNYSQLKPENVESGHFRYHLKQLTKDGFVETAKRGVYKLTPEGQRLADKLSENRVIAQTMPKVITYTLLKDADKLILYKKTKEPYKSLLNMVGGKVHEGETTEQASIREVAEKTKNTISSTKLAGVFEVLINQGGTVFTHAIAYVYVANVDANDYISPDFQIVNEAVMHASKNLAPDTLAIVSKIKDSKNTCVDVIEIDL